MRVSIGGAHVVAVVPEEGDERRKERKKMRVYVRPSSLIFNVSIL